MAEGVVSTEHQLLLLTDPAQPRFIRSFLSDQSAQWWSVLFGHVKRGLCSCDPELDTGHSCRRARVSSVNVTVCLAVG